MKDPAADQSEAKFREQCRNELIPGCPHCLYKLPPFGKWVRAPALGGLTKTQGQVIMRERDV